MIRSRLLIALWGMAATAPGYAADAVEQFLRQRVYELRSGAPAGVCHEWPAGLPDGLWGNAGDYAQKTARLAEGGTALLASAIYRPTGEKVVFSFYRSQAACEAQRARLSAPAPGSTAGATGNTAAPDLNYVQRLQRDFGARLHFASPLAEAMVKRIDIDCRAPDGRHLPLYNALLARLQEADESEAWMETRVSASGNNLSVYDSVHLKSGKTLAPRLTVEISEQGGVKMHDVRRKALVDACFGAYGPIWRF